MWNQITAAISAHENRKFIITDTQSISGGCINKSWKVIGRGHGHETSYFVKSNEKYLHPMFEAESAALAEIESTNTIYVPTPISTGISESESWLLMEFCDLKENVNSGAVLGQVLASMHGYTQLQYGWHLDNTIGSTSQLNTLTNNWLEFWRDNRLGRQLKIAESNGYGGLLMRLGENLMSNLNLLLENYKPQASLLHGDLWGGNCSTLSSGAAIIFDPATYYGDRETDLAMTELFGGFSTEFYRSYREHAPLGDGYPIRKKLYNLYHILNHLNLFGGSYGTQAESMMGDILSEIL